MIFDLLWNQNIAFNWALTLICWHNENVCVMILNYFLEILNFWLSQTYVLNATVLNYVSSTCLPSWINFWTVFCVGCVDIVHLLVLVVVSYSFFFASHQAFYETNLLIQKAIAMTAILKKKKNIVSTTKYT